MGFLRLNGDFELRPRVGFSDGKYFSDLSFGFWQTDSSIPIIKSELRFKWRFCDFVIYGVGLISNLDKFFCSNLGTSGEIA